MVVLVANTISYSDCKRAYLYAMNLPWMQNCGPNVSNEANERYNKIEKKLSAMPMKQNETKNKNTESNDCMGDNDQLKKCEAHAPSKINISIISHQVNRRNIDACAHILSQRVNERQQTIDGSS